MHLVRGNNNDHLLCGWYTNPWLPLLPQGLDRPGTTSWIFVMALGRVALLIASRLPCYIYIYLDMHIYIPSGKRLYT